MYPFSPINPFLQLFFLGLVFFFFPPQRREWYSSETHSSILKSGLIIRSNYLDIKFTKKIIKNQTALQEPPFTSDSGGKALPTESPELASACFSQVFPFKHLVVLGTASWQLLLELCDLTLRTAKFSASIILLSSAEIQQRMQIIIHTVLSQRPICL